MWHSIKTYEILCENPNILTWISFTRKRSEKRHTYKMKKKNIETFGSSLLMMVQSFKCDRPFFFSFFFRLSFRIQLNLLIFINMDISSSFYVAYSSSELNISTACINSGFFFRFFFSPFYSYANSTSFSTFFYFPPKYT